MTKPSHPAIRYIPALWLALTCSGPLHAQEEATVLENARIAVGVDKQLGAIRSIRDKELDITYPVVGISFALETDRGKIGALAPSSHQLAGDTLTFTFNTADFAIRLHYRLGAGDRFVEKWFELAAKDKLPFVIQRVTLEDADLGSEFQSIHFHDDQTIWECPINLFLRGEKGGCFAGIAYPYWEKHIEGHTGFRLGFAPHYTVPAKEIFLSETYFLGVFRNEGIKRYSQGPYPGKVPNPYVNWSAPAGLHQHFKDNVIPPEAVKSEVLDWGEVWAMQDYMRHFLPDDLPLPEDGYWIWQNGWWAGLYNPDTAILDQLKETGINDIMTAHTWYGRGIHPNAPPYLAKMRTDPMGFPHDDGLAGMPGPAGPGAGLHVPAGEQVGLDRFLPGKFTDGFMAPPAMEAFHQYGQRIGVHVSSFSVPGFYFEERPEWASIDEDGKVSEYLFGRKLSCPAVDGYMEHMLAVYDQVFTKYKPRWWGFDGRWLSYWEVPRYRPGTKGLGFDTCHAKDHGHPPGDNLYKEWKNIQNLLRELRVRHPEVCLEQYLGLKRGGPWALRHLNSDDNYYETNGAMMNRFQTWHNQNDRFRPVYKNYSAIFGGSPAAFRTNVLSSISTTSYCQIGPGYADLALEENREFLKKWRAWATANLAYLKVKRDLFGCPGFHRIDGSAHIIGDRGFLFLFPSGTGLTARGVTPMTRWIGLDEKPGALYRVTEIFPQEGRVIGTYRYGDDFAFDMPMDSPVVLSLEPAPAGAKPEQNVPLAEAAQVEIVKAFTDEIPRLPVSYRATADGRLAQFPSAGPKPMEFLAEELTFDGTVNDAIDLGDLALKAPVTLSFSIKPGDTAPDRRLLSQTAGAATQAGVLRLADGRMETWDGTAWQILLAEPIPAATWTHIALVFGTDGKVTAYRDGKAGPSVPSSLDFSGVSATLGGKFLGAWGEPFLGSLKSFRIHARALTAQEVIDLPR